MQIRSYKSGVVPLVKVLLAVAVLLGTLILVKVAGFFVASSKARAVAATVDQRGADVGRLSEQLAQAKSSAEQLKKKNLFVLPTPKQHPVKEVLGILGNEVLIGDKWYKAGESVGDAKIVAIEPTKVRIAWDGQEKEFAPIGAGGAGSPPERRASSGARPGSRGGAEMVVTGSRRGPGSAGREGSALLSSEEREKLRERWGNMSEEERQRFREGMRERFGRRDR